MSIKRQILDTDQKALEINLTDRVYGTFAEIGAGQEVARIFFKVGAAAGTIAKTMSAYDKTFSDRIYGTENSGRYVCEHRLYKMLDHEYDLLHTRLRDERPEDRFFVFADTIAALNYQKTIKGNGWMGVRFQLRHDQPPNDFVLHVKMLDHDTQLQQSAIGVLGVNMIYACFNFSNDIEAFLDSLLDGIRDRVIIDLVRLTGPDFTEIDNRLICLRMVQRGLTDVAMFDTNGQGIHGSEFLYKRSLMVVRGNFRPPTFVTEDVFQVAFAQFKEEPEVDSDRAEIMAELTLDYLAKDGQIDIHDFLSRAECLAALGHKVIVSNCSNHISLIHYLQDFRIARLGLVIGVRELTDLINEKYREHADGMLLAEFGHLFTKNLKVYAYPALSDNLDRLITLDDLPIEKGVQFLMKFLLENHLVVPIHKYNRDILSIIPHDVYANMQQDNSEWEKYVSRKIVSLIRAQNLFGLKANVI